ncbi:MAG: Gfo/Idh/MocA family oxidoreductase [Acidobacteria bacterium]|nr:Gfo/Idh/MocA family oxidoreductase [Acidobacteriota bacterium]
MQIGVAIVGCGYWGQNLIRNFWQLETAAVAMVCDEDAACLERTVRCYPTVKATRHFEEILSDTRVDGVAIATPVSTHFQLARRALEAGKHVLVEKPICQTSLEVLELMELAQRRRRVLMVDHTFLYTAAVRRMKQLIASGEIGGLLYYDSVRVNLGLVQSDTNVLWDLGPHDFSIMDHLCDLEPRSIQASAASHLDCPFEDIAYVTVRFQNSLMAHFHLNWLAPVKVRLTLVGGSKKMLVYDDLEPSEKVKVYDRGITVRHDPERRSRMLAGYRHGDMLAPQLDTTEALRLMAQEFISSIGENRTPLTDGVSGYRVVRLLEAAQQSIEQNGREIELAEPVFARSVRTSRLAVSITE